MTDPAQLASEAVKLLAAHLGMAAGQAGQQLSVDVGNRLYELVRARLGSRALDNLESSPDDAQQQAQTQEAIATAAATDREFASSLSNLVEQANSSGFAGAHVTVGNMRRSQFAVGNMTIHQSRQTVIRVGVISFIVVLLMAYALLRALSPEDRPGTGEQPSAGGTIGTAPGLVMVACSGGGLVVGNDATLTLLDPASGEERDHASFTLPRNVSPTHDCSGFPSAYRRSFNKEFTKLAVEIYQPSDDSRHVGVVDIRSGALNDLTTVSDAGFSSAPRDSYPVFNLRTGEVWYASIVDDSLLDSKMDVLSINLETGSATKRATAIVASPFVVVGDARIWPVDLRYAIAVNEAGTAAVADGVNNDLELLEYKNGALDRRWLGGGSLIEAEVPGADQMRGVAAPAVWVDATTLLAITRGEDGTGFSLVSFSDGYDAVTGVRALLPETDRINSSPVLSPDRSSIAFLSQQGETVSVYSLSLAPGASPKKIVTLREEQTQQDVSLLAWR